MKVPRLPSLGQLFASPPPATGTAGRAAPRSLLLWALFTELRSCPGCGSAEIRPSALRYRLWHMAGLETWRCRTCQRRFPLRAEPPAPAPARPEPRRTPVGEELKPVDDKLSGSFERVGPRDEEPASTPRRRRRSG